MFEMKMFKPEMLSPGIINYMRNLETYKEDTVAWKWPVTGDEWEDKIDFERKRLMMNSIPPVIAN